MSEVHNIKIEEGVEYTFDVLWQDDAGVARPIPAGTTAALQVRAKADPSSELFAELTETDGLTLDLDAGSTAVKFTVAKGLAVPHFACVYDLFLYPPAVSPVKLLRGSITKELRVTVRAAP